MTVRIINADVMDGLAQLDDESVHCCVTSPPYWGLRDYGAAGQIGLEPTLQEHIAKLVEVFREVRRVLRKDGTLWLNYGDAYAGHNAPGWRPGNENKNHGSSNKNGVGVCAGFKPKDLLMMPERLAIAMQDDGWYIRSRIIWHKPNPMPESVTDRPTKSHEHIWLMSRSPKYFYDADAIREDAAPESEARYAAGYKQFGVAQFNGSPTDKRGPKEIKGEQLAHLVGRNARDVWTIATSPFAEAHFATFPPELAERCIKAGCPENGTVLDPFGGSGTTGLVADRLQRNAVMIELNPTYAAMARKRVTNDCPLFTEVPA